MLYQETRNSNHHIFVPLHWLNLARGCLLMYFKSNKLMQLNFHDNKAIVAMTNNSTFHSRTKSIDIQNLVASGRIILKHCNTNKQVDNILTSIKRQGCEAKHFI